MLCHLKWQSCTHHVVPSSLLCLVTTDYNGTHHQVHQIQLHSGHRVPLHGIVSSCHDMGNSFRISCDRAILCWYTSITLLIVTCFINGFMPHLHERVLEAVAILQQGGAPAHYALPFRECLVDKLSG